MVVKIDFLLLSFNRFTCVTWFQHTVTHFLSVINEDDALVACGVVVAKGLRRSKNSSGVLSTAIGARESVCVAAVCGAGAHFGAPLEKLVAPADGR